MNTALPDYVELHCLSNFSFLRGASHAEELVMRAAQLGYEGLAITDECSVAGVVRAHEVIKDWNATSSRPFQLIIGAEFAVADAKIVLIASNRSGYGQLCSLISLARQRSPKGSYRLEWEDLVAPDLFVLLASSDPSVQQAGILKERFTNVWLAVELLCGPNDGAQLAHALEVARIRGLTPVAAGNVHMHVRSRRPLQDTLTAIRHRQTLVEARGRLYPNAERHLRLRSRLARLYPAVLLAETVAIAKHCHFVLDELRYEYPDELVPAGHTATTWLRTLTEDGLHKRYPSGIPSQVRMQVEKELALIGQLKYEPYFLTVQDIVHFAEHQRILCQGRGSAANSAVCYCLGITAVDPEHSQLLFERFLSPERNEPPDIDVDFEHERREEVIQYIYGKYGRDRAALAASVIRYKSKSAIRDVGKVLGFDMRQVDMLAKALSGWDNPSVLTTLLREAGFNPAHLSIRRLVSLVKILIGFPRHLSQHVGGFVISRGPLSQLVPIENAAMPERSVIQWDKDDLESLGLLKIDVLALGMLSALRRALQLSQQQGNGPASFAAIPQDDPAVYQMIGRADTIGVFQVESRAQMSMLPRMRPLNYYDLVIQVSLVRPGPIQGGMVHPYLERRGRDPETIEYPSPQIKQVLERTLGVLIFQEQVMELAVVAAGFTPGNADALRRAMASWRRKGNIAEYQEHLREGLSKNHYSEEFAEQISRQILGFGEYGFPESHAASFAILVYYSAWFKHYHPEIFLVALLNSQPMGFYSPSQLIQDARRHDVEVLPVDVLHSVWDCALEAGNKSRPAVRLGLRMVNGISEKTASRLAEARHVGAINDLPTLARHAKLTRRELDCLTNAAAFANFAAHRRTAHWAVAGIEAAMPKPILDAAPSREITPYLIPPTEGQDIVADYASLGFTLGRHPLALLRSRLKKMGLMNTSDLRQCPHGRHVRTAGIVVGRQQPETASGTVFVTLEDESGNTNVVIWNRLVQKERRILLSARLLAVYGVWERRGEVAHLIAQHLVDRTSLLGALHTTSRDFH